MYLSTLCICVLEKSEAVDFPAKKQQVKGHLMQFTMQCSWTTQWRKVGQCTMAQALNKFGINEFSKQIPNVPIFLDMDCFR